MKKSGNCRVSGAFIFVEKSSYTGDRKDLSSKNSMEFVMFIRVGGVLSSISLHERFVLLRVFYVGLKRYGRGGFLRQEK